jgi:hypothetical protein
VALSTFMRKTCTESVESVTQSKVTVPPNHPQTKILAK